MFGQVDVTDTERRNAVAAASFAENLAGRVPLVTAGGRADPDTTPPMESAAFKSPNKDVRAPEQMTKLHHRPRSVGELPVNAMPAEEMPINKPLVEKEPMKDKPTEETSIEEGPANMMGQQLPHRLKNKDKKDDLRLEFELKWPLPSKIKKKITPSPATSTKPTPLVRLDRPLVPAGPAIPPEPMQPMIPPAVVVPISSFDASPRSSQEPSSPRIVIIDEPTREHQRNYSRYARRSNSHRHHHHNHNHRGGDHRAARPRSTSPGTRERQRQAELARRRQGEARLRRVETELTRRRYELEQARRAVAREAEIARLGREIDSLEREAERQRRARQKVWLMIHQDGGFRGDDLDGSGRWGSGWRASGGRGRERSRSFSRGLRVVASEPDLALLGREIDDLAREAEQERRVRQNMRPMEEEPVVEALAKELMKEELAAKEPVEEKPTEEQSMQEEPIKEKLVENALVEEELVDEEPVKEPVRKQAEEQGGESTTLSRIAGFLPGSISPSGHAMVATQAQDSYELQVEDLPTEIQPVSLDPTGTRRFNEQNEPSKVILYKRSSPLYQWLRQRGTTFLISIGLELRRFFEASLKPNETRLRWRCKCGHESYDDFPRMEPEAIKDWEAFVRSYFHDSQANSRTKRLWAQLKNFTAIVLLSSSQRALNDEENELPRLSASPRLTTATIDGLQLAPPSKKYVLLAFPYRRWGSKLWQPKIENEDCDQTFFRLLRSSYGSTRSRFRQIFSLKNVKSIEFAALEVYESGVVNPNINNPFPQVGNPDYDFDDPKLHPLCPSFVLHMMHHPEEANRGRNSCLRRIPKRLNQLRASATTNGTGLGWGLHFVEGWYMPAVWLILWILIFIGIIIFLFCWTIIKQDAMGAATIGASLAGMLAVIIASVQTMIAMDTL